MRHSGYFVEQSNSAGNVDDSHMHDGLEIRSVPFHAVLLVAYMVPIVLLSKSMARIVDFGIAGAGAPAALGGLMVAVLVLAPEGLAALQAARADRFQRSVNICLGSALATIGLTVPALVGISIFADRPIVLGLDRAEAVLLMLTVIAAVMHAANPRTNIVQGLVHLVLFATYVVLIFD